LRLAERSAPDAMNRQHFLAIAARAMRHVVIDYLRRRQADKRGGGVLVQVTDGSARSPDKSPIDLIALDEALGELEKLDSRQATIVELRFFGGLELSEIAGTLQISDRTVKRDWQKARAFLFDALH